VEEGDEAAGQEEKENKLTNVLEVEGSEDVLLRHSTARLRDEWCLRETTGDGDLRNNLVRSSHSQTARVELESPRKCDRVSTVPKERI
jgi:hypothetical protein